MDAYRLGKILSLPYCICEGKRSGGRGQEREKFMDTYDEI